MRKMEVALRNAGFCVENIAYPSRTASVEKLSDDTIGKALETPALNGCSKIHFVTHSLGGILVRSYFKRHKLERLGRVVMLGPPNQGSEVVDALGSWSIFRKLNGPAGGELGTKPESTPNQLGPVEVELGVIAGDRSINWINSLMIEGPDDGKVVHVFPHAAGAVSPSTATGSPRCSFSDGESEAGYRCRRSARCWSLDGRIASGLPPAPVRGDPETPPF